MNTPTVNHEPNLLVDPGAGVILEAPPKPIVTERYVDSHPFIERVRRGAEVLVYVGPDAGRAARGVTAPDSITYKVIREVAGSLHLERIA